MAPTEGVAESPSEDSTTRPPIQAPAAIPRLKAAIHGITVSDTPADHIADCNGEAIKNKDQADGGEPGDLLQDRCEKGEGDESAELIRQQGATLVK